MLLLVAFCTASFAQQGSNAGLTGTVTDKSGAAIAGAPVVATNLDTNVTYTAIATGAGVYNIPSVPPGSYDVSTTVPGFNKAIVKNVIGHVGELSTVNLKLDVSTTSNTVTVSGDAQLMDTGSSQINNIVAEKELETWPISATGTSPGGERDISQYIYNNLPGATGISFTGSINGGQTGSNEIYYEGLPLGSFDTGEEGASVDAVREMSVQTGVMNAQYNGGATAVTNVALKSGTNAFHGSLVGILQNEDMNANSYAANQAGHPRAEDRFNLFSGSVGGPVRIPHLYNGKDRTFFFFNYERDQVADLGYGGPNVSMPTEPMMRGDFSAWLNPSLTQNPNSGTVSTKDILGRPVVYGQIYDPATTRILKAGEPDPVTGLIATSSGFVRDTFPNNQIPTNRFDPVAANILKLKFPTNYLSSQVVNNIPTLASKQPTLNQHFVTVKVDQVLTSKQKLSLMYDYDFRNLINTGGSPAPAGFWSDPNTAKNVLDQAFVQGFHEQLARINHYWTISPSISNHIGAGYFFVPISFQSVQSSQNWTSTLGIPNFNADGFPQIVFGGQAALAGTTNTLGVAGTYQGELRSNSDYMLIDQVYISHGAHQLQFGFEGRFYLTNWTYPTAPGAFAFQNAMTDDGDATANYAGNAFASFELGQIASLSSTIYDGTQHYRRHEEGLYFQDDWKVTPRLTFNLGLRWEPVGALYETRGEWSGVDLSVPNSAAGNLPGALVFASQLGKNSFENPDWKVILPRVGFAYNPTPRIVFRAGFGINSQAPVYSAEPFQGSTLPPTTGYTASVALNATTNPQAYSSIAVGKLSNPYPFPTAPLPNYNPAQSNLQSVTVNNPNGSKPMLFGNYTGGFQIDAGHGIIGQINYVGNAGRRIRQAALTQKNQLPLGDLSAYGDELLDNISLHPDIPLPYPGFTGTVQQALAPIPQYAGGGVTLFDAGEGWSRYDALQATLNKQMTKNLSFFINYTWSKTLTDTNGGVQDIANLKAEKAVASFLHVPQIFKFTAIYALPFGKGEPVSMHGPLDWALGGWKLAGNGIYQSGDTLAITDSFVSNGIFATSRPNYTGLPVKLNSKGFIDTVHNTGPLYLNPAAFTHVPYTADHKMALTTGSVPSILPGIQSPGYAFENLGLQKGVELDEGRNLSFRADAFNVFNRAGRGDPVTDINNANFGRILGTQSSTRQNFTPRTLQAQVTIAF
ncbi:carboxypeptidase regulatory-like domain-containing protein [Silvibacterium acidisoli]|uniref:carboxypeptidase regulatory-like domain-containing protein n=1 Tax=Acidobacteriaceae bacterium ZG23-2 TaxID=2883246 RepID=UPI00406CDDD5